MSKISAVIIDGDAMASCMILTVDCDGKSVTTIEGLQDPITGELDPKTTTVQELGLYMAGAKRQNPQKGGGAA